MENYRDLHNQFDIQGKTAIVTGGGGVLGSAMARALAGSGARVAVMGRRIEPCEQVAREIRDAGDDAFAIECDVTDRAALERAAETLGREFPHIDILINAAGGSHPGAITTATQTFFDLDIKMIEQVLKLNYEGTLLPCQVFGRGMAERKQGVIVNIGSMNAERPLTRTVAYGAAKAGINNFTRWLAVYMAKEYSPAIRVNALTPGFFLTDLNRTLLTNPADGTLTERGEKIIAHTPMGRFGKPDELLGTLLWLVSPASKFVTGIVVEVDGGFTAYAGV